MHIETKLTLAEAPVWSSYMAEDEKQPPKPDPEADEGRPNKPRELTPEEREELEKRLKKARKEDPNIYPLF
jgi:hypothetical protein